MEIPIVIEIKDPDCGSVKIKYIVKEKK